MTKQIFIVILFFFISSNSAIKAQEIADHAIGLRISDSDNSLWAEASYQAALSSKNRVELDLGLQKRNYFNALKVTGIYQWVFNIDGSLNWYTGPGIGGGLIDYDTNFDNDLDDRNNLETFGFITGNIGIEYSFDFPLLVSLDFRPEIYFDDYTTNDDLNFNIGLSARYKF